MLRTICEIFRLSFIAIVPAVLLAACQAADGTSQAPDTALVAGLMKGLGAVDPHEKQIEYKPRAPLAMPSDATKLPQPETRTAGSDSANWPKNEANASLQQVQQVYAKEDPLRRDRLDQRMNPQQMGGIALPTSERGDPATESRSTEILTGSRMTSQEMKAQNGQAQTAQNSQKAATGTTVGTRKYLTDPPSAYSQPAANAPMPETVGVKQKPTNYDPYDSKPLDMRCLEDGGGECRR